MSVTASRAAQCLSMLLCVATATAVCVTRTTNGKCCVFPFIYRGMSYKACTSVNHDRPWCSTTASYDWHKRWGNCVIEETQKNLARGKPTEQSSPYRFPGYGEPSNAVDGNTSGDHMRKTCTHTTGEDDPWWRVDLGSSYLVNQVVVYNRVDCCSGRLRNMEIRIGTSLSNHGNSNPRVVSGQSLRNRRMRKYSFTPRVGRYVNIRLVGRNMILTLCEVEVFGVYTDVRYHLEGGKQSCDTICQKHGLQCASTSHGFTDASTLAYFRDKGKNCLTGFDTDDYQYDDNPVYITELGWARRCVGWRNIPHKIDCRSTPGASFIHRLCPCIKGTCESYWRSFQGSNYKFCHIRTKSWIAAQKTCQNLGANLVKIETKAENEFLSNVTRALDIQNSWMGLRRGWDNLFYWTDGSRPTYANWLPNEPNKYGGKEYCTDFRDGNWNDVLCSGLHQGFSYVCEKRKCLKPRRLLNETPSIVASSYKDYNHTARFGVLTNASSIWCPQGNSTIEWLEVDLGAPYFICGVAAVNDIGVNNRTVVTWYRVAMSLKLIVEDNIGLNASQEFRTDPNSDLLTVQELHGVARYLRFMPTRWVEWPCMKIAVYGDGKVQPLRMVFGVTNKTVEHVSSTTLSCFARGFPFPSYTWTKDGSSVIPNGVLSEQNTVLQLSRVTMASEGWYTCTATTSLGSANSSAYLAVHAKPQDLKVTSPVNALKDNDTVLSCESFSNPVPNVTWTREGQIISDVRYSVSNQHDQPNNKLISKLTIRSVAVEDMGIYKCRFSNYRGSIEGEIRVGVLEGCHPAVFNFERGANSLKTWGQTGRAFRNQPTFGDNVKARNPRRTSNHQGNYWIGTYENRPGPSSPAGVAAGNGAQGLLISPEFQITGPNVSFLLGGQCDGSPLELLVGGQVALSAAGSGPQLTCGQNPFGMTRQTWNLQPYIGKRARLRLKDFSSRSWGHVSFDDFRGDIVMCKGCSEALGMTTGRIPDFAISSSSMWDKNHGPKYGRLYTLRRDGHVGSWSSRYNLIGQWLQVDLGTAVVVTKIATQGRASWSQWVTSYRLSYSSDGSNFQQYDKVLTGNNDRNTIVENVLSSPIRGRYIRIYPKSWYNHISMRMELYGCPPKPVSPKIQGFGLINETTTTVGSDVVLYCAAIGYPYLSYLWTTKEAKPLASGQRLTLHNVSESRDGVYTCTATNTAGTDKLNIRLHVNTFPAIVQGLSSKQVMIKNKVSKLQCEAKGKPKPTAVWYKDGKLLTSGERILIKQSGDTNTLSVLQISNTKLEDGGDYKCMFRNTQGTVAGSGRVEVHAVPEFTLKPRNKTAVEGQEVRLDCTAGAVPVATYRWKVNGEILNKENIFTNGTLTMKQVGSVQEGVYTCEASNSVGSTSSTAWVTVNIKPFFKTPPLSHKDVVRAQTAVIHCDVMGKPVPEVDWSKDGSFLKETGLIGFQSNKHILVIRQLKTEDSGLYKCEARNIVGKVTAVINIKVFGEPNINSHLTRRKVSTRLGTPASLACLTTNPLPVQYSWSKDGEVVHNTKNLKVHNNILVVKPRQPKDFGAYVCHMSNIAGSTNYSITLVQSPGVLSPAASTSAREGAGLKLSILIPLVLAIVALVAVIIILVYRHRRASPYSFAPGDTMSLTAKEHPLLSDEQETSQI